MWMGSLLGAMFLGLSILAARMHIVPDPDEKVTVLAQIARGGVRKLRRSATCSSSLVQVATMLILVLAANTSYADFPRLASFHAGDHFLPKQLTRYGDRLVFSNGIVVLSVFAGLLVIVFEASVTNLIPLYAIGVFTSFTFSQAGMAKRHTTLREPGWKKGLAINGFGAVVTAVMTVIIAATKFSGRRVDHPDRDPRDARRVAQGQPALRGDRGCPLGSRAARTRPGPAPSTGRDPRPDTRPRGRLCDGVRETRASRSRCGSCTSRRRARTSRSCGTAGASSARCSSSACARGASRPRSGTSRARSAPARTRTRSST